MKHILFMPALLLSLCISLASPNTAQAAAGKKPPTADGKRTGKKNEGSTTGSRILTLEEHQTLRLSVNKTKQTEAERLSDGFKKDNQTQVGLLIPKAGTIEEQVTTRGVDLSTKSAPIAKSDKNLATERQDSPKRSIRELVEEREKESGAVVTSSGIALPTSPKILTPDSEGFDDVLKNADKPKK